MGALDNLTKANDMKRVREVDFVSQFTHNSLAKLIEVLGVTRKIPMMEDAIPQREVRIVPRIPPKKILPVC